VTDVTDGAALFLDQHDGVVSCSPPESPSQPLRHIKRNIKSDIDLSYIGGLFVRKSNRIRNSRLIFARGVGKIKAGRRDSMATQTLSVSQGTAPVFPAVEAERRLRVELEKIAKQAAKLRPEWIPLLDSKRVVGTVLVIVDLFPGTKLPPDKVVRKGGYNSVDEAIKDVLERIKGIWSERSKPKVRK
jgi:hypothetical protein